MVLSQDPEKHRPFLYPRVHEVVRRNLAGHGDAKAIGIIQLQLGHGYPGLSNLDKICLGYPKIVSSVINSCVLEDEDEAGSKVGPFPTGQLALVSSSVVLLSQQFGYTVE